MDRVVISVTSLSKENWMVIYHFIRSILNDDNRVSRTAALAELQQIATISLKRNVIGKQDVCQLDDTIIKKSDLDSLTMDTAFSLIYVKEDDAEDFTELVQFILLKEEFKTYISLGIDIDNLDYRKQSNYIFKCSYFLIFYIDDIPQHGFKSLYFINEKSENNDYFSQKRVTSLRRKNLNPSRNFLPLIYITEDSYKSLFGTKSDDSKEQQVIIESFSKMLKAFSKRKLSKEFDFLFKAFENQDDTFFGKWLECVFFYSLLSGGLKTINIIETRNTIQTIKTNLSEIVQNIIFHAGKRGLLYCVFDKKNNISEKYRQFLPDFNKYKDSFRFLRAGIFDFSDKGIVDTFIEKKENEKKYSLNLLNFFDTNSIVTTNLIHLDLRYAAHLGLKTFVKSIINNKGFFSVETNVSNSRKGNKKQINTILDGENVGLSTEADIFFVNGTHYEIVFPVSPSESVSKFLIPLQKTSLLAENFPNSLHLQNQELPLKSVKLPVDQIEKISICLSKDNQIKGIEEIGDRFLDGNENKVELAINLDDKNYDYNIIFKLLAYIQLNAKKGLDRIILINAKDDFVDQFCKHILSITEYRGISIWSKNKAIILITKNLHAQIIWGEKKNEFDYINSELSKYYCFNFFARKRGVKDNKTKFRLDDKTIDIAKSFIVPYDVLVNTDLNQTPFELFIKSLLKHKILSDELGFLVNHENTYIGNKIIVRNFYEADMMFQNTFFTERFAYLIANNIERSIREHRSKDLKQKKKIVIIGYKHYSELILKAIKRILKNIENIYLIIANIDKDSYDYSKNFNFDIEVNGGDIKRELLDSPDSFYFASIVPVGSTLSTNNKVIAFFKYWYEQQKHTDCPFSFIYNHCVIVVRDTDKAEVSKIELEHNWEKDGIDFFRRVIKTNYYNAKEVHYTVQIANVNKCEDEEYDNWVKRLNKCISFPPDWQDEKYVNYTENSSINSQNLMGFPSVEVLEDNLLETERHNKELQRLYKLKHDIIKGHLIVQNCHHKFYVHTEAFVRRNESEIKIWLTDLKKEGKSIFDQNQLNILITPSPERESDLIYAVNNHLFDGNALIVYLDIKNWRNNIVHKLSFLKEFPSDYIRFHYVDQALLTGETFRRTHSYLFSILRTDELRTYETKIFASIIVLVNRLPCSKTFEFKNEVDGNLYTYLNLYYPSSKIEEPDCELCDLIDYYKKLIPRTVLDSCKDIISKNLSKLKKIYKEEIEKNSGKLTKRNFLRLAMTHELYYLIAYTAQNNKNYTKSCDAIIRELNNIYSFFSNDNSDNRSKVPDSIIVIDSWFKNSFLDEDLNTFYNSRLVIDKRISFLKVISSPPLSRYIIIRQYAHKKLLVELNKIINTKKEYTYDDLKIVKSILKSLSFLKSNALVRKDVIIGVWKVLGCVVLNLESEKCKIEGYIDSINRIKEKINKSINSPLLNYEISIDDLHEIRKHADIFLEELENDKNAMNKLNIIQDFSRDVQFFIKNALVDDDAKATFLGELLRRGEEITDFDNVRISKTILSLKNQKSDNDLFNSFVGNCNLERDYINFLVWLFYDNTTIIRKTLDNFAKEIQKNEIIKACFYDVKESRLYELKEILIKQDDIEDFFTDKVRNEYYYSSFKPYLHNGDRINYVEKLIYVTYAKLKLEDIIINKNKKGIETDTKELMEVFAKIMGADSAFWTMKKEKEMSDGKIYNYCYVISQYGFKDKFDQEILNSDYYTKSVFTDNEPRKYPLVPKFRLDDRHAEKKDLGMTSLAIFYISKDCESENIKSKSKFSGKEIVASITFLYNENNDLTYDEETFRVFIQESGRLMLLLKSEIEKYAVDLIKDKALDLWESKYWSVKRFEKIYANNAHIFKSVYEEMEEFEHIGNNSVIKQLSKTWYFLTNETISYLYSDIEKNTNKSKHYLNLFPNFVVDKKNTIGKTFNSSFIAILCALLDTRWNESIVTDDNGNILRNQIYINDYCISDFKVSDELRDINLFCNKHIIRTFIAQCLHNSLSILGKHGHRGAYEIKRVNIKITYYSIIIEDTCLKEFYSEKAKKERKIDFKKKKKLIKNMRCDEYSSTTLTTIQGVVNYMCKLDYNYSCNFGFNKSGNFKIVIKFNGYEKKDSNC